MSDLIATGLDINPQSFVNGDMMFKALDSSDGVVIIQGLLNANAEVSAYDTKASSRNEAARWM